jgi:phospholipid/cholesterol/gamma-HCH transport system substrate-binding protein
MTEHAPGEDRRNGPSDEEIMRSVPKGEAGREVRLGVFVIVGLLSFVVILFLLTDPATFRGRYVVFTRVENAGGIRAGDPVQMRGVNIGRVRGFDMTEGGMVDVALEVEGEWSIPEDSYTRLGGAGLFGGRTMEVVRGEADAYLDGGDRIPGEGDSADPFAVVEEVGEQATTVMTRIEDLLDEETVGSVRGGARELEELLREVSGLVDEQRGTLDQLTESLARSAEGLEAASEAGPEAARAVSRADSAMAVLVGTSRNLDQASVSLRTLLERMERGEGTLGRLSTDETLYENLSRAAERMAALAEDIQADPSRYIRLSIF